MPNNEAITTNEYDHAGRVLKIYHSINTTPTEVVRLTYDEISRLQQKKILPNGTYTVGGVLDYINRPPNPLANTSDVARKAILLNAGTTINATNLTKYSAQINPNAPTGTPINGLQTMDYKHHIRGGLLGINLDANENPVPKTSEGDLFSYKLGYETAGYFDGNIGKQTWNNGTGQRHYDFSYDAVSRLKSATYAGLNSENYSLPNMNYDKNGNITQLQRNGKVGNGFGLMDNLSYNYNGNKLNHVSDGITGNNVVDFVPKGGGNYIYYNDGSLKSDDNEKISNIIYDTYLKQPKELQLNDGTWIKYYYDGSGRLFKTVYSTGEIWDFIGGMILKNGQFYQIASPEGRAVYQSSAWQYEFFYTDHLGNTRTAFKANGTNLEKTSETAFDPWGVVLRDAGQVNGIQNRFEFQGKESEKTFGLNRIDLGARTLNPTIGRMDRVDNFADKYFSFSPFHYTINNPLRFIDINGDSLVVNGDQTNIKSFLKIINQGLDGFYTASHNKTSGLVTLSKTKKSGAMSQEQSSFYDTVSKATSLDVGEVNVNLDRGSPQLFGGFSGTIDMGDIEAIQGKSNLFTAQGVLGHEIAEQTAKQVKGVSDYNTAHNNYGISAENKINGSTRGGYYDVNLKIENVIYNGKSFPTKTGQTSLDYSNSKQIDHITIDMSKNNIVNIKVKTEIKK